MTPQSRTNPVCLPLDSAFSSDEISMDLTTCGLLIEQAETLARLYATYLDWTAVERVWFDERLSNRSTRGSAQKIYRILSTRFKNAPSSLPNASVVPTILDDCATAQDKAQVLYLYLLADDPLVRYVVHEYVTRMAVGRERTLDFSNTAIIEVLTRIEYTDGSAFDYAASTVERWCEGFRSVMREIGVLEGQENSTNDFPTLGDVPLLVALEYSHEVGTGNWMASPVGLRSLFQPETRWEELYDRAAETGAWNYTELHSELRLRPTDGPYAWAETEDANE